MKGFEYVTENTLMAETSSVNENKAYAIRLLLNHRFFHESGPDEVASFEMGTLFLSNAVFSLFFKIQDLNSVQSTID